MATELDTLERRALAFCLAARLTAWICRTKRCTDSSAGTASSGNSPWRCGLSGSQVMTSTHAAWPWPALAARVWRPSPVRPTTSPSMASRQASHVAASQAARQGGRVPFSVGSPPTASQRTPSRHGLSRADSSSGSSASVTRWR